MFQDTGSAYYKQLNKTAIQEGNYMEKTLLFPFTKDKLKDLRAGDSVLITGTIYTARDAAHARIVDMMEERQVVGPPDGSRPRQVLITREDLENMKD